MQALTAVVMGGTDINGGRGTVAGTIISVLILQVISNVNIPRSKDRFSV